MYTRIYVLRFLKDTSNQPIIYRLVKEYDVEFNILKADILPHREGLMILELQGSKDNVKNGLKFLESFGVEIKRLAAVINRDDEKCFQCGSCTGVCPVGALSVRKSDMHIVFEPDMCTGCGQCVTICPVQAMQVTLEEDQLSEENLT